MPDETIELKNHSPQFTQAMELAEMLIPQMNGRHRDSPWQSFLRSIPGLRRFARPGPKPRLGKFTWSGRSQPNTLSFLSRFGAIRYDSLDWDTLDVMRRNPMVKLGLVVRASPIFTALREARVECADEKIKAFIEDQFLNRWLLRVASSSLIPGYVYGSAPHEKVWETKDLDIKYIPEGETEEQTAFSGPALVYGKIDFVHPSTLEGYLTNKKTGDFEGFVQQDPQGGSKGIEVEAWKAFVYSNRFLFGGYWGESEEEDIYPSWYYASFFRALLADYVRLRAIPPVIGHAPWGSRTTVDGDEVDNISYAGEVLLQAFESQVVVLPWEPDPNTGNNMWGYSELSTARRVEAVFIDAIEELEVNILRGLLVPERTVTQNKAAVGSYNQAEIHQERLLDMTKLEVDDFVLAVNRWLIPQLVEDNFGANAPECRIFVRSVSERLKEKLFSVLISLLQNDTDDSRVLRSIALQDLLKFLDVPFTVPDQNGMPVVEEETPEEEPEDEIDEDEES